MDEFALFQSEIQELEETNAKEESKEEDKVPRFSSGKTPG